MADNNEGVEKFVSKIEFIDGRTRFGKEINETISLDNIEDSSEYSLAEILNNIEEPSLITVYNVPRGM